MRAGLCTGSDTLCRVAPLPTHGTDQDYPVVLAALYGGNSTPTIYRDVAHDKLIPAMLTTQHLVNFGMINYLNYAHNSLGR